MRTETIYIYKFEELSPEAQKKVIQNWQKDDQPFFCYEVQKTMDAVRLALGVSLKDWSYSSDQYHYKLNDVESLDQPAYRVVNDRWNALTSPKVYYNAKNYTKQRKSKITRQYDNCPFTGVTYDNCVADAIVELRKPENFLKWTYREFVEFVFTALFSTAQKEWEYWESEECIIEDINANETMEFYADGRQV